MMSPLAEVPYQPPSAYAVPFSTGVVSESAGTLTAQWNKVNAHSRVPLSRLPLQQRFADLAATWQEERGPSSRFDSIVLAPSYQRIIAMGTAAVPLILAEIRRKPDHWFWALHVLTGVNPIPDKHLGDVGAMTADWLSWGAAQGF